MEKRIITTRSFVKTPVVRLTEVDESTFIGKMVGSRETKYGLAFDMTVVEGDAPINIKDDSGNWVDVDVSAGDKVNVLTSAGGQLEQKLKLVDVGETAEIIFNGKVLNPKSGRQFNDFTVSVLESK